MSKPPSSTLARYIYTSKVEWYWKCLLRPLLLRIGAGLAVMMSVLIVWSEVCLFCQHHFSQIMFLYNNLEESVLYLFIFYLIIADNVL